MNDKLIHHPEYGFGVEIEVKIEYRMDIDRFFINGKGPYAAAEVPSVIMELGQKARKRPNIKPQ